jgi:hypothetical protein
VVLRPWTQGGEIDKPVFREKPLTISTSSSSMPDKILLIIFGTLSTIALLVACLAIYFAVQNAKKKDGEIKMALWSFVALGGFVFAGMCWAYFLMPLLINNLFR